jgi:MFS family permease
MALTTQLTETRADPDPRVADVQRRTLRVLFATQVLGGVGTAVGLSVGALLAADMVGVALSGLAQSAAVVGTALVAIPATRIVERRGRRPSLAAAYGVATLGSVGVVAAAMSGSVPLLFLGLFLFGGSSTAGYQARYAAVDLAPTAARARQLSLIVWATTIGAVAGPNLAPFAGAALARYGVPTLAAPFAFSGALFVVAAAVLVALLRPDPLVVARETQGGGAPAAGSANVDKTGMGAALRWVASSAEARLGMTATAVGHLVMVGVMAMTPVHIRGAGHDAALTLRIVGVVLSLHIAGMFAFAPLTGWLTDRYGRRPVIFGAIAVLLLACAVAGTAGHGTAQLAAGLTLLGLGWSGTMVAGSTLLSESVPTSLRPSAQGLADVTMSLAGAVAGALSGVVVGWGGYPTLTLIAAAATLPLAALAMRPAYGLSPRADASRPA